ncbi:hypothetical protein ABZ439_16470 [Streptomyces sp. NPDC005840]|uniref:DUF3180 domain-containing protein n=1 Tax=Streptomyces doudnae TaxID=3075536 RepID=A0ABD5ELE9_9ACTN|nr:MULTISPECIES: hypothetical protein [unclassified Streptomyces]MDT0434212.1 hypothetical protein [Streptomyces sp. DSM 41981]MYQ67085.1 hypothetical protein [Streptomyces sp. SID4950]SCE29742.1 hypothetical protein GA0115242_129015 [Streptomyces sp. SolWspMP-5a-2]
MPRHEFQPGKLLAGMAFALAGVTYAGDAAGLWEAPWFAIVPIVVGGLCLAGAAAVVAQAARRRRAPRRDGPADAPPDRP